MGLGVAFILFGIGALTYAKHPEGVIEAQTTASIRRSCCASTSGAAGRSPPRRRPSTSSSPAAVSHEPTDTEAPAEPEGEPVTR